MHVSKKTSLSQTRAPFWDIFRPKAVSENNLKSPIAKNIAKVNYKSRRERSNKMKMIF